MGKLLAVCVLAGLLLAYPGWRNRGRSVHKSFFVRLLEVLVLYGLVGTLGFAFEANMGNVFTQTWEFYAVTLSLRSEEHTSELQSLMRISYAVFCLKKKNNITDNNQHIQYYITNIY